MYKQQHANGSPLGVPRLESCGVSRLCRLQERADGQVRPTDVLLRGAQDIRTGVGPSGSGSVALDVGIICPQAAVHLGNAAGVPLGAAEAYVKAKCGRGDTERRCSEAGVVFRPMIFESAGGVSAEADRALKFLTKAVAGNTDPSEEVVATRLWHCIGVDLLRGRCRAFQKRIANKGSDDGCSLRSLRGAAGLAAAVGV